MEMKENFIRKIKEIDIEKVLDSKINESGMALCPLHDDHNPSLHVTRNYIDLWYCHACGKGGTIIDLIMHRDNLSFTQAVMKLSKEFKIPVSKPEIKQAERDREKKERIIKILERAVELAHLELYNGTIEGEKAISYLKKKRSFSDDFIAKEKIGYFDKKVYMKLREEFEDEDLLGAGLLIKVSGRCIAIFKDRIVYAYRRFGRVVYLIGRKTPETPDNKYEAKYKKLPTNEYLRNDTFFNEDAVWGAKRIIITEGVTDCLSLKQEGFHTISPVTTNIKNDDFPKLEEIAKNADKVYVLMDNEENGEGEKSALKLLVQLWTKGIEAKFNVPPRKDEEKVDVDSWLTDIEPEKRREAIEKLLQDSKNIIEYYIEKLNGDNDNFIEKILQLLVDKDSITKEKYINILKKKTVYTKKALEKRLKEIKSEKKKENINELIDILENATNKLVYLAKSKIEELFRDQFNKAYAVLNIEGHREIVYIKGRRFKLLLTKMFWDEFEKVAYSESLNRTISLLEAEAYSKMEIKLYNRVAWHDNEIWYDLTDDNYKAVRISKDGWEIVENPPILFRSYIHQKPANLDRESTNPKKLLDYINIDSEEDKLLLLVCVVTSFIPNIPHPIIVCYGPHGSAKSVLFKILKLLIDSSAMETLSLPTDIKEFVQQCSHHWCAYYDNVSHLSNSFSDAFCRAATGEGFSKRELYSDDTDFIYSFKRCLGVNAINISNTNSDFLDRAVIFKLDTISVDERKAEYELMKEVKKNLPSIRAGIFDILSKTMKIREEINIKKLPRMADFAIWGEAVARALGEPEGKFLRIYKQKIDERVLDVLEENLIGIAILKLMEEEKRWENTPMELLEKLTEIGEKHGINVKSKRWPVGPSWLTRRVREVETELKEQGIIVDYGKSGHRRIILEKDNKNTVHTDLPTKTGGSTTGQQDGKDGISDTSGTNVKVCIFCDKQITAEEIEDEQVVEGDRGWYHKKCWRNKEESVEGRKRSGVVAE